MVTFNVFPRLLSLFNSLENENFQVRNHRSKHCKSMSDSFAEGQLNLHHT